LPEAKKAVKQWAEKKNEKTEDKKNE